MAERPPPPPIDAELAALIEKLAADLPSLPDNDEASRRFEWLLDALILRGQLPASFKRLAAKIQADRGTKIRLSLVTDKYEVESPDIDCASRIHLCGARCCSFEVALSPQDIAEKKIPFVASLISKKLIDEVAPKFKDRPGGYTRIIRLPSRRIGDGGDLAILQLVGFEEASGSNERGKTVSRRREQTANRIRFLEGKPAKKKGRTKAKAGAAKGGEAKSEGGEAQG